MIKKLLTGIMALSVASAVTATAATANAPTILIPDVEEAQVISGLSDNGRYGVASIQPQSEGFSYTVGAVLYDLTGSQPKPTDLTLGHYAVGAFDVTDDGKTVVGTADLRPAFCVNTGGKWQWEYLPVPNRIIEVEMEDFESDETYTARFQVDAGHVVSVTPDGRYAVGVASCSDYEIVEIPMMWDLTTKSIVPVNSSVLGRDGVDYRQARYLQTSADGRYILCWNAFSYNGSDIFIYDRVEEETIHIDKVKNADGTWSPRVEGFGGVEFDGYGGKHMSPDGRYLCGAISDEDGTYAFLFEIPTRKLTVFKDGVNNDVYGWSVTNSGLPLAATPAITPYADALVCYDNFQYPISMVFDNVYGMKMESTYGIDNTGKPTKVSADGRTIVFVTGKNTSYVARFNEDIEEALKRVNLMADWNVTPRQGTSLTTFPTATFTFTNPIEADPSRYAEVQLLDSKGDAVMTALENGGVKVDGSRLTVSFRVRGALNAGETYTLVIPEGIAWVMGRPADKNARIEVKYVGRADVPVAPKSVSPASGTALPNLDLNDNPIEVTFDTDVRINGDRDDRPIAHLYIDDNTTSAASLILDVDLATNHLIIYPANTVYLYKGSEYTVKVPAGAVCDLSGNGASEAFQIKYTGSYVPQVGDDQYLFRSTCDNFSNFLVYEGDYGEPTAEYAAMDFTPDTTPWWYVREDTESEDMAFGSHSSYTDGRQADDWLVLRQLNLPANTPSYLNFQSQSYRKAATDRLKVIIYENNESYNQLTPEIIAEIRKNGRVVYDEVQSPGNSEEKLAGEWRDNTVSLEDWAGKSIYICFLNDNAGQSMVMIDNVEVMKEVKAFLTLTTEPTVVKQESAAVKGMLTVVSDLASYKSLSMLLLDGAGKEISRLSASGLNLKKDDLYPFEFPQALPLQEGERNKFTIKYALDQDEMEYSGAISNLSFQPVKRVVIEECTGRDCSNCPLGLLALEKLEQRFGHQVIPVALHAYQNDPKGLNVTDYAAAVFNGNFTAPQARINRRSTAVGPELVGPTYRDPYNNFHFSASEVAGIEDLLWQDVVTAELAEPAFLEVNVVEKDAAQGRVAYTASVTSALNLTDQNIRVLGVLMEDGLWDRQANGIYVYPDPALGEFGQGGKYGTRSFEYEFDNVAVAYWGQSTNGTARLIPATLEAGRQYEVAIDCEIPAIVKDADNLKMAVYLIDENTGKVVNAALSGVETDGIGAITDEAAAPVNIYRLGDSIVVEGSGDLKVSLYGIDGTLLSGVSGRDSVAIPANAYRGIVIVSAVANGKAVSRKLAL